MLIKLRLQCIGNVCCVLVYSQTVYSTQLCVHTEQWIHNFGLTPVLAQRLAVWSLSLKKKKKKKKKKKNAPWRADFREPRSTALYPIPRYNEARYNEGRLYLVGLRVCASALSSSFQIWNSYVVSRCYTL